MPNKIVDNLRSLYDDVMNNRPINLDIITDSIMYIECIDTLLDYYENDENN